MIEVNFHQNYSQFSLSALAFYRVFIENADELWRAHAVHFTADWIQHHRHRST